MLTSLPREYGAYAAAYKGKQILIGALDESLPDAELQGLRADIASLGEASINLRVFAPRTAMRNQLRSLLPEHTLLDASREDDQALLPSILENAGVRKGVGWEEMLLLRNQGGLKRKEQTLPLLSDESLDEILGANERKIDCDAETREIITATRFCIQRLGKIVITDAKSLQQEIGTWMGAGTLIFDHEQLSMDRMYYGEHPIFDAMYEAQVQSGAFRKRSETELEELRIHHEVVRIKNSVLGGMSLLPRGKWQELSALWGSVPRSGIGKHLLDQACKRANGSHVAALTVLDDVARLFHGHPEFAYQGTVQEIQQGERRKEAPVTVQEYDTSGGRKPYVFYRTPPTLGTPASYPTSVTPPPFLRGSASSASEG